MENENNSVKSQDKVRKLIRISLIAMLTYSVIRYFIAGIIMLIARSYYLTDAISLITMGGLVSVLIWWALHTKHLLVTVLIDLTSAVLIVAYTYDVVFEEGRFYFEFVDVALILALMIVFSAVSALLGLIKGFMDLVKRRVGKNATGFMNHKSTKVGSGVAVILGILCVSYIIMGTLSPAPVFGFITLDPGSDQTEIALWGDGNPVSYNVSRLNSMNDHHVLIIDADMHTITSFGDPNLAKWVNKCVYWRDHYSNVKLMPVVHGVPGGAVWDGSAKGTTDMARILLSTAVTENLTNVVGFSVDMETPGGVEFLSSARNRTRHYQSAEIWADFFQEMNDTYSSRFQYQCTFWGSQFVDDLDGDDDLEVWERIDAPSVNGWNEYAPMLYTGGGKSYYSEILDADGYNFRMYKYMSILKEGLAERGIPGRHGAYLGITNMSVFGFDNRIRVTPDSMGPVIINGYEELVFQAKITKATGAKRVTLFLLQTVGDMGGVFDSYGEKFLDQFDTDLNGLGSDAPFQIPIVPEEHAAYYFPLDVLLTNGIVWFIPLFVILDLWIGKRRK